MHNTISDRIIRAVMPLLLESALALNNLVREEHSVTWSDAKAVDAYIAKLQNAVEKLNRDNNRASSFHYQLKDKTIQLMGMDLLRHEEKWKERLKEIRGIIAAAETAGFRDLKGWKAHWDHQLYKALEHQYQVGLESLNQHLPGFRIELVYQNQELGFKPPMEEIRRRYYGQMKKFLSIPNKFKGKLGREIRS